MIVETEALIFEWIEKCAEQNKTKTKNKVSTGEHGEHGCEGVELEPVNDVAGVDELQTHEAETHHQQNDVEHLRNQRQPQHPCRKQLISARSTCKMSPKAFIFLDDSS